jgi:hypothetical protein
VKEQDVQVSGANRTRDQRGTPKGILSDREWECASALRLQTAYPTKVQAQKYLLANWPTIEKMARDALAAGTIEDGQIKLIMT